MYKRNRCLGIKPPLHVTERDIMLQKQVLCCDPDYDLFERPFRLVHTAGKPAITFIGSSHVYRMNELQELTKIPDRVKDFLSECKFVGVGGLKFWTAEDELNGIFTCEEKLKRYGNQWEKYTNTYHEAEWAIVMLGGNDTDDSHGYFQLQGSKLCHMEFVSQLPKDIKAWLNDLRPHVVSFIKTIQDKCKKARIGYVLIMPRILWSREAWELGHRLYFMIL